MSDEAQEYQPTPKMLALLRVVQANDYTLTMVEATGIAGVDEATYYHWHTRTKGFTAWWKAETERYFARHLGPISGAMLRRATGRGDLGDVSAAKLMLERYDTGYCPRNQTDINGKHNVTINADAELERRMLEIAGGDTEGHSAGGGVPSSDVPEST